MRNQRAVLYPTADAVRVCNSFGSAAINRWLPLIACVLASGCDKPEPIGPVPAAGYDYSRIDYDRPRFPAATNIDVPAFFVGEAAELPFALTLPAIRYDLPISFTGEIHHPNDEVQASLVRVHIYPLPMRRDQERESPQGGMQGFAKGEHGELRYRLEGRVPKKAGRYLVKLEVWHLITDPEVRSLPAEQRMTTTVVAEGELLVIE